MKLGLVDNGYGLVGRIYHAIDDRGFCACGMGSIAESSIISGDQVPLDAALCRRATCVRLRAPSSPVAQKEGESDGEAGN